jgi:hypothetical protein
LMEQGTAPMCWLHRIHAKWADVVPSYKLKNNRDVFFVSLLSGERVRLTCKSVPRNPVPVFKNAASKQGCQMVYFQTKNPNLGKFCRALEWKMSVYFLAIGNILRPMGIVYGHWVILRLFGIFFTVLVHCQ